MLRPHWTVSLGQRGLQTAFELFTGGLATLYGSPAALTSTLVEGLSMKKIIF